MENCHPGKVTIISENIHPWAEVVPSSSLVELEVEVEVGVGLEVGVGVEVEVGVCSRCS